jgi:chloramphenicol-sensitive protein RarD
MAVNGPATVVPLALFSWARRLPFSTLGFLQYIAPTMTFVTGLIAGEALTPLRAVSFVFIWMGAAVFAFGAWRAARRARLTA